MNEIKLDRKLFEQTKAEKTALMQMNKQLETENNKILNLINVHEKELFEQSKAKKISLLETIENLESEKSEILDLVKKSNLEYGKNIKDLENKILI